MRSGGHAGPARAPTEPGSAGVAHFASTSPAGVGRRATVLVAITALYFFAGKVGLSLAFVHASATAVWPPAGIALAAVLWSGFRIWPAVLVGAFLVNVTTAGSAATSLGIATGNTLEALAGAYLVQRFASGLRAFERAGSIFRFALLAGMVATAVSPTIGVTSLAASGYAQWADFAAIWWTWWLGDAGGVLVLAPALITWAQAPRLAWNSRRAGEAALLLSTVVLVGNAVFGAALLPARAYPLEFLCLPPLLWAAFRFRQRTVATCIVLLAAIAVWGTLRGSGPFVRVSPNESLLLLQAFLATISVTMLPVSALVSHDRRVARARERLRASAERERARLSAVLRHMPAGVMIAEAPSGRIILGNEQVERIWGHPFQPGQSLDAYRERLGVRPDGRPYEPGDWPLSRSLAAGETVMEEEVRFRRGDGEWATMSVSSAPIHDQRGRTASAVVIFSDVTDRKRAEAAREEFLLREQGLRREAEAASRAKDEFLAMLSHELRNPLAAVANAARVLRGPVVSDEHVAQTRAIISRQIDHLARLIDDLLDVARVTTGGIELQRQPTDLAEAVRVSLNALRLAGAAEHHQVTVDAAPAWVSGDATRLEQVITNLVANALKYTPHGGHVRVRTGIEGPDTVLEVEDNGPGIAPDALPRVFDLFYQAERGLDRAQGGLGIGLTLVQRLVRLHDGAVAITRPASGQGTLFTVRLPALAAAPAERPPPGPSPGALAPRRVLVIEDHEDTRESFRLYLESSGHSVACAADGPSGIEAARRFEPDIAFVDIGLPGIDGYEVARALRASSRGEDIVLVALTGYGRAEDRARSAQAGFDAHLIKPVAFDRLAEPLSTLRRRLRSAASDKT